MGVYEEVLRSAELLAEGAQSMLYRASMYEYGGEVILKVLKTSDADAKAVAHLRNEYALLAGLHVPGVRQPLDLIKINQRHALVQEFIPGQDLRASLNTRLPEISQALSWAIKLCTVMEGIHRQGILHGGLCSRNVLISDKQEIFLLDFGQSQPLPLEAAYPPDIFVNEESLPYLAPELSGKLLVPIDQRADLYALGVILFELLTGELPYAFHQPKELIHAHLALSPPQPHLRRKGIPPILSEIISRLLAKDPAKRYQSAFGLRHDLELCAQHLSDAHTISFTLGLADSSGELRIPNRLAGVEEKSAALLQAWQHVKRGSAEMVWIGGPAGTGKSSLTQQFAETVQKQQGFFLSGKYDQYQQQNQPYAGWISALEELLEKLLTKKQEELNDWRERITVALGSEGKLVANLLPKLKAIIGNQPNVPELEGLEAQNRFLYTFRNFLRALATDKNPVVLFLDDLHWADSASLKLLQSFIEEGGCPYLLLVVAFRNDEVPEKGVLPKLLKRQATNLLQHTKIGLKNLDEPTINSLLSEILDKGNSITAPLAQVLHAKTGGNPLFFMQFLKTVFAAGYLRFDRVSGSQGGGQWSWDIEEIAQMPQTENVLQLMQNRIAGLASQERELLQLASCMGAGFTRDELAQLFSDSEEELINSLYIAIREGFFLELKAPGTAQLTYRFTHDRIRQAVYSTLDTPKKQQLHYQQGKFLLDTKRAENQTFVVAEHWNIARALLSLSEREKLLSLNLQAAKQAIKTAAYEQALRHLQHCIDLLPQDHWKVAYAQACEIYSQAAGAAYLSGQYDEMEAYVQLVLQQVTDPLHAVKAQEATLLSLIARNRGGEAIDYAMETLEKLGITFPENPSPLQIVGGLLKTEVALARYSPKKLEKLPAMTNPKALAIMQLMSAAGSAVSRNRPLLFPLWVYRLIRLSLQHGLTQESIPAFGGYGILAFAILGDSAKAHAYGQLALQLQKKMHARAVEAKTLIIVSSFLLHWRQHLRDTLIPLRQAYQAGLETGDQEFAASALMVEVIHEFQAGENLKDLAQKTDEHLGHITNFKQELIILQTAMFRQAMHELQQEQLSTNQEIEFFNAEEVLTPDFIRENKTAYFYYQFLQLQLNYLLQRPEEALEATKFLKDRLELLTGTMFIPEIYYYEALTYLASNERKSVVMQKLAKAISKLKNWAKHAPMNFQHKYYLLRAEQLRLKKRAEKARSYYDRAAQAAHDNGYLQDEAIAYELAGRYFIEQHQGLTAEIYLQKAFHAYNRWGAHAKAIQLKSQLPIYFANNLGVQSNAHRMSDDAVTLSNLLEVSEAISSDIRLEAVMKNLLRTFMQIVGAQRGYLMLDRDEGFVPVAKGISEAAQVTLLPKGTSIQQENIPSSVVNYTFRTGKELVLSNAYVDKRFTEDEVIKLLQIRSVLCLPIRGHEGYRGMVYLENSLASGSFAAKQIELVKLLSGQMAITLENALLYEQMEHRVEERTRQLSSQRKILVEKNQELQTLNEEKDELVHIVAHDLRSPLNQVKGMLNLVRLTSTNLSDEQKQYIDLSSRAADRLNHMIARILSINTLQSQQLELKLETVDLELLLEEIISNFQLQASEKDIHIELILPEESCEIELDKNYTIQVVENLLSNAIKFSPEATKVSLHLLCDDAFMRIEVSDEGPGISAKDQKRLFSKFQTLAAKPTGGEESTGLGLAIAKRFVEAMGGEIGCQSELGEGSTFYVCFPIA